MTFYASNFFFLLVLFFFIFFSYIWQAWHREMIITETIARAGGQTHGHGCFSRSEFVGFD
jgi:hypothetical protein